MSVDYEVMKVGIVMDMKLFIIGCYIKKEMCKIRITAHKLNMESNATELFLAL